MKLATTLLGSINIIFLSMASLLSSGNSNLPASDFLIIH